MTAPARFRQADIERVIKAAQACGDRARVVLRLEKGEIEVIIGESGDVEPPVKNEWDQE